VGGILRVIKEVSNLSLSDVITLVLSEGAHEGHLLLREVSSLMGEAPSQSEWRKALFNLVQTGAIKKHVSKDDDGEIAQVIFTLPGKN
jgi:hypothetical protein